MPNVSGLKLFLMKKKIMQELKRGVIWCLDVPHVMMCKEMCARVCG